MNDRLSNTKNGLWLLVSVLFSPLALAEPSGGAAYWSLSRDAISDLEARLSETLEDRMLREPLEVQVPSLKIRPDLSIRSGVMRLGLRDIATKLSWNPQGRIQVGLSAKVSRLEMEVEELRVRWNGVGMTCRKTWIQWHPERPLEEMKASAFQWSGVLSLQDGLVFLQPTGQTRMQIRSTSLRLSTDCPGGPLDNLLEDQIRHELSAHWSQIFQDIHGAFLSQWHFFPQVIGADRLGRVSLRRTIVDETGRWWLCFQAEDQSCSEVPIPLRMATEDSAVMAHFQGDFLGLWWPPERTWSNRQASEDLRDLFFEDVLRDFLPNLRGPEGDETWYEARVSVRSWGALRTESRAAGVLVRFKGVRLQLGLYYQQGREVANFDLGVEGEVAMTPTEVKLEGLRIRVHSASQTIREESLAEVVKPYLDHGLEALWESKIRKTVKRLSSVDPHWISVEFTERVLP